MYIWGSCAKSHETMLRVPRREDRKARFVGTQVWKVEEKRKRKSDSGSQCAGREGSKTARMANQGGEDSDIAGVKAWRRCWEREEAVMMGCDKVGRLAGDYIRNTARIG